MKRFILANEENIGLYYTRRRRQLPQDHLSSEKFRQEFASQLCSRGKEEGKLAHYKLISGSGLDRARALDQEAYVYV